MQLRVTRPGFIEGIRALKAVAGRRRTTTPNTMATRQEMRAYVCGQCHVEYYFKGAGEAADVPVGQGHQGRRDLSTTTTRTGSRDWTHAETGAPALKAQHPEFEMWNQGIHARSGVACADCHMPYMRVGAHEDQRPPRAQPAAQHQPRLPDAATSGRRRS